MQVVRRLALADVRLVMLDPAHQLGPQNHRVHLGQNMLAPRYLPISGPGGRRKLCCFCICIPHSQGQKIAFDSETIVRSGALPMRIILPHKVARITGHSQEL